MPQFHDAIAKIRTSSGEEKVILLEDDWIKTAHSDDFVFCMTGIAPNIYNGFEFTTKQKEQMLGFGDTVLVITDVNEFCRRIKARAEQLDYKVMSNFIYYYDESIDEVGSICSPVSDMRYIAFQKRKRYSFQQEFRFLVTPNCNIEQDHVILEIGDIRDITSVIKSKDILKSKITKEFDLNGRA